MEIFHLYDDIINMPHHVSDRHPQMPMIDRAAQFSPFAALTGYDAAIVETARLTEEKRELSEEQKQVINEKLRQLQSRLKTNPVTTVVYYQADRLKTGGSYEAITGTAKKVDGYLGVLEMSNGIVIPFEDIMSLE